MLVVLLGHGTFDGDQAKFNLVGPDLTAGEWSVMLGALPARVVVVNTTESSAPFIEALAAKGRVVITATDTGAQKYATVFPEYFAKALADAASDLDKDGKTSIWEVFSATSGSVARHYTERAQLTTERVGHERHRGEDRGAGVGRRAARARWPDRCSSIATAKGTAPVPKSRASSPAGAPSRPRPRRSSRRSRAPMRQRGAPSSNG